MVTAEPHDVRLRKQEPRSSEDGASRSGLLLSQEHRFDRKFSSLCYGGVDPVSGDFVLNAPFIPPADSISLADVRLNDPSDVAEVEAWVMGEVVREGQGLESRT